MARRRDSSAKIKGARGQPLAKQSPDSKPFLLTSGGASLNETANLEVVDYCFLFAFIVVLNFSTLLLYFRRLVKGAALGNG